MTKVIIAGTRTFEDYNLLRDTCDKVLSQYTDIEIVSGSAPGADTLGEQYAKEKGYPIKMFPAYWKTHGKAAGPIRNQQMADYADVLIAFWDGKSKGTRDMIYKAQQKGLRVKWFPFPKPHDYLRTSHTHKTT